MIARIKGQERRGKRVGDWAGNYKHVHMNAIKIGDEMQLEPAGTRVYPSTIGFASKFLFRAKVCDNSNAG